MVRDVIQAKGQQRSRSAPQYTYQRPDNSEHQQIAVKDEPLLQRFNLGAKEFSTTLNQLTALTYRNDYLCFGYTPEFARLYNPLNNTGVDWGLAPRQKG